MDSNVCDGTLADVLQAQRASGQPVGTKGRGLGLGRAAALTAAGGAALAGTPYAIEAGRTAIENMDGKAAEFETLRTEPKRRQAAVGVLKSIIGEDGNVGERHLREFNEQMGASLSLPRLRRLKNELGL